MDIGGPEFSRNGVDTTLHGVLAADFQFRNRFPSLDTLDITIVPRRLSRDDEDQVAAAPPLLFLHCCAPSVKHLRIRSPMDINVVSDLNEDSEVLQPEHMSVDDVPIELRTIYLDVPSVRGVVPWM